MKNKSVYIYQHETRVLYAGQTKDPQGRFGWHRKHHQMCKDYPDGVFRILAENLSQDEANELERIWIEMFDLTNEGYNKNKAFSGTNIVSEETRQVLSSKMKQRHAMGDSPMKGRKHSDETRALMSKNSARANLGRSVSAETRKKISEAKKGKTFSDEHRKNLSENKKKYYAENPDAIQNFINNHPMKNPETRQKFINNNPMKNPETRQKHLCSVRKARLDKRQNEAKSLIESGQQTID